MRFPSASVDYLHRCSSDVKCRLGCRSDRQSPIGRAESAWERPQPRLDSAACSCSCIHCSTVVRIKVIYASQGVVPSEKSRLRTKARGIEELIADKFQGTSVEFQFLGARGLVELAHRKPALDFSLDLENAMNIGPSSYDWSGCLSSTRSSLTARPSGLTSSTRMSETMRGTSR